MADPDSRDSGLLQVGLNDFNQHFQRPPSRGTAFPRRIDDVHSYVTLDYLSHQAVDGPACRHYDMQHLSAALLFFERALDGFDLAANAPHPV